MEVNIRRQWNDWKIARIDLSKISNLHWDRVSGGINNLAIQSFIHGYVWCDEVIGELAHSCEHGPGPHNIKVVLVKKDNTSESWKEILKIVGPKPG